jgi:hypothetical protein
MIDMNYFSSFDPDIGFRVGVEAIHKNNEKAFFCIMMSVCPNASYYSGSRGGPPSDVITIFYLIYFLDGFIYCIRLGKQYPYP